jgi:hypothetical protein
MRSLLAILGNPCARLQLRALSYETILNDNIKQRHGGVSLPTRTWTVQQGTLSLSLTALTTLLPPPLLETV